MSARESSKTQVDWIATKYIHPINCIYYNLLLLQCRDQHIHFTDENIEAQSNYKARWTKISAWMATVLKWPVALPPLQVLLTSPDKISHCTALGQREAVLLSHLKLHKLCHTQTAFQQAVNQVPRGAVPPLHGKCLGDLGCCSVADLAVLFGFPWNLRTSFKHCGYWLAFFH